MEPSMTDTEKAALSKFKNAIKDVWRNDHDDPMLLKFLRARSFNIDKAEDMYRKNLVWRAKVGADTLLTAYKIPEAMDKYYPGGMCGRDKQGRPVWIDPLGRADLKGIMLSTKKTDIEKALIYRMEELNVSLRKATEEAGRPITQCSHIMDMEGVGSNFMWRPALSLYMELIRMLQDNYPESQKVTFIVKAPSLFRIGYAVIKNFMDKDTAKKFMFLDNNWKQTLAEHFDMDTLPVYYGGRATDPDGDPKCSSRICYGGKVPVEMYGKKEDFFPSPPKDVTIYRSSRTMIAYYVPDQRHTIRYTFSTASSDIEFAVYFSSRKGSADLDPSALAAIDVNSLDVIQEPTKYDCQRIPEDGLVFFPGDGVCYIQFKNPSSLFKRVVSYHVEVTRLNEDNTFSLKDELKSGTLIGEEDYL